MSWQIEFIQLHFYNGCDNRWQMYPEGEGKLAAGPVISERFFRVQVAKLLLTIRKALEGVQSSAIIKHDPKDLEKTEPINIRFDGADAQLYAEFTKFLLGTLDREGIVDDALREAIATGNRGTQEPRPWIVPRESRQHLLSALPIAREWDVFGWLHPMSTSSVRFQSTNEWKRHFAYQVRFIPRNTDPTDDQPLVGRDVILAMHGSNGWLTDNGLAGIPYYNFAKSPRKDRSNCGQPCMTAGELGLYNLYAAVVDAVQQGARNASESYFVVFPVLACGYFHFLELKMLPPQEGGNLVQAHQAVMGLLPDFDYLIMKESVRELIVQIRLSAFQHHVTAWIRENASRILRSPNPNPELPIECFCKLAPLLNEMRAIVAEQNVWSHAGTGADPVPRILKSWVPVSPEHVTRDNDQKVTKIDVAGSASLVAEKYRRVRLTAANVEIWLFHEEGAESLRKEFFEGTNHRRLEEQFEVVQERVSRVWNAWR